MLSLFLAYHFPRVTADPSRSDAVEAQLPSSNRPGAERGLSSGHLQDRKIRPS